MSLPPGIYYLDLDPPNASGKLKMVSVKPIGKFAENYKIAATCHMTMMTTCDYDSLICLINQKNDIIEKLEIEKKERFCNLF